MQRRGIKRFASHAEDLDATEWYCDEGVSGRKETRPELSKLMDTARRRSFGCVLVWKSRAASREASRTWCAPPGEFNHLGIRFASVQDRVDTGSPMGKAMS